MTLEKTCLLKKRTSFLCLIAGYRKLSGVTVGSDSLGQTVEDLHVGNTSCTYRTSKLLTTGESKDGLCQFASPHNTHWLGHLDLSFFLGPPREMSWPWRGFDARLQVGRCWWATPIFCHFFTNYLNCHLLFRLGKIRGCQILFEVFIWLAEVIDFRTFCTHILATLFYLLHVLLNDTLTARACMQLNWR